jgi:hypothetical protein
MGKVVVVDHREAFLSEVAMCCKSFDTEVIQAADPTELRNHGLPLRDVIVAIWADFRKFNGMSVPKMMLRAISVSRMSIPVILYSARAEAFAEVLEPGMPYPYSVLTAHACSLAGTIKRVMNQWQAWTDRIDAFEDWACQNQVSIAGTAGKVSVFTPNGDSGFEMLAQPQDPLAATGCLLAASSDAQGTGAVFY